MRPEQIINPEPVSKLHRLRFLVATLVLVFSVTAITNIIPLVGERFDSWQLLPKQEPTTELYVTEGKQPHKSYTPGQVHNALFTVHNLEGDTRIYKYTVSATDAYGIVHPLRSGTFQLSQDQIRHNIVPVTLDGFGVRARIDIKLSNGSQIYYWLDKK